MSVQDAYALGRDRLASTRLTHQHFLWKKELGFNLHPSVNAAWEQEQGVERRIADVACGNCIWTVDESTSHPSTTKFVAFDISDAQFPPQSILPPNVKTEIWNAFEEPPAQYQSYFDAIAIRLIIPAIRNNDPRPVLQNVLRMLKPGGVLQWAEVNLITPLLLFTQPTIRSTADTSVFPKAVAMVFGRFKPDANVATFWATNLASIFVEYGLEVLADIKGGEPAMEMRKFWNDNNMGAMAEVVSGIGVEAVSEVFRECEREVREEGVMVHYENLIVVGRKKR